MIHGGLTNHFIIFFVFFLNADLREIKNLKWQMKINGKKLGYQIKLLFGQIIKLSY